MNNQQSRSVIRSIIRAKELEAIKSFTILASNNIGFLFLIFYGFYDTDVSTYTDPRKIAVYLGIGVGGVLSYFFAIDIRVWLLFSVIETFLLLNKIIYYLNELVATHKFNWIGILLCLSFLLEFGVRSRWLRYLSSSPRSDRVFPRRK